jgi:hypothetical protein
MPFLPRLIATARGQAWPNRVIAPSRSGNWQRTSCSGCIERRTCTPTKDTTCPRSRAVLAGCACLRGAVLAGCAFLREAASQAHKAAITADTRNGRRLARRHGRSGREIRSRMDAGGSCGRAMEAGGNRSRRCIWLRPCRPAPRPVGNPTPRYLCCLRDPHNLCPKYRELMGASIDDADSLSEKKKKRPRYHRRRRLPPQRTDGACSDTASCVSPDGRWRLRWASYMTLPWWLGGASMCHTPCPRASI